MGRVCRDCVMHVALAPPTRHVKGREACTIERPEYAGYNAVVIYGREYRRVRPEVMNRQLNLVRCAADARETARDVAPCRPGIRAPEDTARCAGHRRIKHIRVQR